MQKIDKEKLHELIQALKTLEPQELNLVFVEIMNLALQKQRDVLLGEIGNESERD